MEKSRPLIFSLDSKRYQEHVDLSFHAFHMYSLIPTFAHWLYYKGAIAVCSGFQDCGGTLTYASKSLGFFMLLEFLVYLVHLGLHTIVPCGHNVHHEAKTPAHMSAATGFAFEPFDGTLQGVPFIMAALIVTPPLEIAVAIAACTCVWTMGIHVYGWNLPYPFMGANFHAIHHKYNRFNYGLFTIFWDSTFQTLKTPSNE